MRPIKILLILTSLFFVNSSICQNTVTGRWPISKVQKWYTQFDWLAGTNFMPSTAINQLEFWQEESFDLKTIDQELKWSAELGFNVHRVYLHNLVWEYNSGAFLDRLEKFLNVADSYRIKVMFVLLDDVWDPYPKLGKQPSPQPGLHNSGWVQSPGRTYLEDESKHLLIKGYVQGVIDHFKHDNRILLWDLYNEPDNHNNNSYGVNSQSKTELLPENKEEYSYRLLVKVLTWAREVAPSQPITMGIWKGNIANWGNPAALPRIDRFMINNSDLISFHAYDNNMDDVKTKINQLKKYNRPMICTEYMARTNNNTFQDMMPLLKKEQVGAISWGFVAGKSNTIYPWKSWKKAFDQEPEIWFHDILRPNGLPFSKPEVELIQQLTTASKE